MQKIYLLDYNKTMCSYWEKYNSSNVFEIVNDDIYNFLENNIVDCIVSPGNSFGLMDGGFDEALVDFYGDSLKEKVQNAILEQADGFLPVADFVYVNIDDQTSLLYIPSMALPKVIRDYTVIYSCYRTVFN